MTEPREDRRLVRYFCTAGNGMEHFLVEEVKKKLAVQDVCQMPGKVLFSSSAKIARVSELKAAERLFLLLKQDSPVKLSAHMNPAKAASLLKSRLLGDRNQWTSTVITWRRLQGELAGKTTVSMPSTALRVTIKRGSEEQKEEEEEKCDEESQKHAADHGEEDSENGMLRSSKQNGTQTLEEKRNRETLHRGETQTLERKRKRDNEEESSNVSDEDKWRISDRERKGVMDFRSCSQNEKSGMISETDLLGRGSVCDHAPAGLEHRVEHSSGKLEDMPEDLAVGNVEHAKTPGGGDEPLLEPSRRIPETPSCSPGPVSFRISCKCTGSLSRCLSIQEVSKVIGAGLSRWLGWNVDLRNPQLEVNVYLTDDHCLVGIPLTRLPLAHRSYIKTTGLRSTVAWAMASLAQIQPGHLVLDPMCGVGTILIEAAQEHKGACFLGMDIDDGQLQKANENVEFAELGNRMHLLRASSMVMPLPCASVDAVVCDLPFGRKFGNKTNMAANLPLIITEMERVLRIGGTLVLLLSPQLSCLLKKHLAQEGTGPKANQESEPQSGKQDSPCSSLFPSKQQTVQTSQGLQSSSTQKPDTQTGLQHTLPHPLSSLKHQATLRVSLGTIDGLIHQYVKTDI